MNCAHRLYGKKPSNKLIQSPFFRSNVNRNIYEDLNLKQKPLGPGEYNIALPFIKPIFQTIQKSNNIFIVKFNHHNNTSAVFKSNSDRFKSLDNSKQKIKGKYIKYRKSINSINKEDGNYKTIELPEEQCYQNNQEQIKQYKYQQPYSKIQSQYNYSTLNINKIEQNQIQQYKQPQTQPQSQSFSPHKLKQILIKSHQKKKLLLQQLPSISFQQQISKNNEFQKNYLTSLNISLRLHNKQPKIIQSKIYNSNRYHQQNKQKSTEWSKYKQKQRKSFENKTKIYNETPGPGSYIVKEPKFEGFNQRAKISSWQFTSNTERNSFLRDNNISELYKKSILNNYNNSDNQISKITQKVNFRLIPAKKRTSIPTHIDNVLKDQQDQSILLKEQQELKYKYLTKKRSKSHLLDNFRTKNNSNLSHNSNYKQLQLEGKHL